MILPYSDDVNAGRVLIRFCGAHSVGEKGDAFRHGSW